MDNEIERRLFKRAQDWAVLIVSAVTILAFLLPIYRKQVTTDDKIEALIESQKKFEDQYVPLIQNTVTGNQVLSTKFDMMNETMREINRKLDQRNSFR